jgi:hypothetical protein
MSKVQVALIEWMGYPLFRKKPLGEINFNCGLGNLLKNMKKYDPGVDIECSVVLNEFQIQKPNKLISAAYKVPILKPLLLNNVQTNTRQKYDEFLANFPFVNQCFYRDNTNRDIGAYNYFYEYLLQRNYSGHLVLINSSVRGPSEDGWLLKYKNLFEKEPDTGLSGISLNSGYYDLQGVKRFSPHMQSFFLYTSMDVLKQVFPNGLIGTEEISRKEELIEQGEIGISAKILRAGFGLRSSIFPDFYYKKGKEWTIPEGDIRVQPPYSRKANAL